MYVLYCSGLLLLVRVDCCLLAAPICTDASQTPLKDVLIPVASLEAIVLATY
jgi:hypothetical protein